MENRVGKLMKTVANLVIVLGIIGSFILGKVMPVVDYSYSGFGGFEADTSYNWALAITGIIVSVITYVLFLGFSEVIDLLERIQRNWQVVDLLQKIEKNQTIVALLERIAENQESGNASEPSDHAVSEKRGTEQSGAVKP